MASFPVNDFTEWAWKSNKIIKIIMGPRGADSVKSWMYNPIGSTFKLAAIILDILVLMYKIFVK